jgi:cell division protein FtsZ
MHASASDLPSDRIEAMSSVRADLGPPAPADPLEFRVLGIGGGGCNVVHRIVESGRSAGVLWALNTDAQHLYGVKAHHKLLIGRNICRGRSANADPRVGEMAAEEARLELSNALRGARLAFLIAALGGGTGSGAAPVVAKVAREERVTTVALATLPFSVEGSVRSANASSSLDKLRTHADFVAPFPNDRLLNENPTLAFRDALRRADDQLFRPIRALALAARAADHGALRRRFRRTSATGAASASATRQRGYPHAAEAAFDALLHLAEHQPNAAVVTIGTAGDLAPHERDAVLRRALEAVRPAGSVLWGYYHDPALKDTCEVSVFLARTESTPEPHEAP